MAQLRQQCLSAIASDGGRFTRIADLCAFFKHQPHLGRTAVEEILGELAANGYLQRHGFKNQYGADERLHQLVDYRMIYGNFSAGSDLDHCPLQIKAARRGTRDQSTSGR